MTGFHTRLEDLCAKHHSTQKALEIELDKITANESTLNTLKDEFSQLAHSNKELLVNEVFPNMPAQQAAAYEEELRTEINAIDKSFTNKAEELAASKRATIRTKEDDLDYFRSQYSRIMADDEKESR